MLITNKVTAETKFCPFAQDFCKTTECMFWHEHSTDVDMGRCEIYYGLEMITATRQLTKDVEFKIR